MWKFLIFTICLTQILSCVESCFLQRSLYVNSPGRLRPGHRVAKVETVGCDAKSTRLTVKDPSFTIKSNGEIVALTYVSVGERGRTFSVCAQDNSGLESKMEVHLVRSTMLKRHQRGQGSLNRSKRRRDWRRPTFNIVENYEGNYPEELSTLVIDAAEYHDVYYTIEGEGVDTYPTGVFSLDRDTGALLLLKALDREEFPEYDFVVRAFDKHTNVQLGEELPLRVIVDDVNDNAPEFVGPLQFTVPEHCSAGTVVGVVSATDRDEIGTDHVKIKYTLVSGSNMFTIHPETGVITTTTNTLDREPLDYEKTITAQNVASLNGSSTTWQSIPMNVNVKRGDG
ncbi:desmocollin-1-like [Neolamprologus brichardi]|uniref:desmocollin-1-like n=1 Tax=Neolamprologus brichardi TaxID=32507 RepID=UPI001643902A|nr:desmocollin-1-like [Neolamprologus brichardi]